MVKMSGGGMGSPSFVELEAEKIYLLSQQAKSDRLLLDFAVRVEELENQLAMALTVSLQRQHEIKQLSFLIEGLRHLEKDIEFKLSSYLSEIKRTQNDLFADDRVIVALGESNQILKHECDELKSIITRLQSEVITLTKLNEDGILP